MTVDPSLLGEVKIIRSFIQKKQVQPSSSIVEERVVFLNWVTFDGSVPTDAVSIVNDYFGRTDYVCKYISGCATGYYTPDKGSYCYYPAQNEERKNSPFKLLINKNNFELLKWKKSSYGKVPENSVCSCPGNICVGKHPKYGLGKVDTPNKAFFLPLNGKEHYYKTGYFVLTTSDDITSQQFHDVQYNIKEAKISISPPGVMFESLLKNYDCNPVQKTDTLSMTYQEERKWETTASVTFGVETTMTAGVPDVVGTSIRIGIETTFGFTRGTTVTESISKTDTVEHKILPNRYCNVFMMGRKASVSIPFTAHLRRSYGNGENTDLSMSGIYEGIQMVDIETVIDRCEILDKSNPCL